MIFVEEGAEANLMLGIIEPASGELDPTLSLEFVISLTKEDKSKGQLGMTCS